jgi:hypothetical protein
MECECRNKKIRSHNVIRHFKVVGNYNMCSKCRRVEWNWLNDELETEINDSLYHYFVKPLRMAEEPYL